MRLWDLQIPERQTHQDKQTQKSLGRYWDGWRQSQDQPQAGTMGQSVLCLVPEEPSIRPLVSLSFLLPAGHTLLCVKPVPFSIYHLLWTQQEGDGGRVGDKRLCPGLDRDTRSIPHWRGDQSIP